jgi:restriction system protein
MAKKSQFDRLVDDLEKSPWWISPVVGIIAFFFMYAIVPSIFMISPFLAPLGQIIRIFSPLAFIFFCFIGVLAFFNQKRKSQLFTRHKNEQSYAGLTWKEFEELVGEAFRRQGFKVTENYQYGADGGIDLSLSRNKQTTLVQCKLWRNRKVGVKIVRELLGVMTAEGAERGLVVISSEFTEEAKQFAHNSNIGLIDGRGLSKFIQKLQNGIDHPPKNSTVTSDKEPSLANIRCPRCGSEMVLRVAKSGKFAGQRFLGCKRFPHCKGIVNLSND